MPRSARNTSDNTPPKPKRPLSAYNLYYRQKRAKILEANTAGDNSRETILRIMQTTPGLEDYHNHAIALTTLYTSSALAELSRANIRAALLDNLTPNENSKRSHRKTSSALNFLEMNKIMVSSWKAVDDITRSVFEELAIDGRKIHLKQVEEFERRYPGVMKQKKHKSKSNSSAANTAIKKKRSSVSSSSSSSTVAASAVSKKTKVMMGLATAADFITSSPKITKKDSAIHTVSDDIMPSSPPLPDITPTFYQGTPTFNTKPSFVVTAPRYTKPSFVVTAPRFITPDTSKLILSQPINPEHIERNYFDCLDIDLSSEDPFEPSMFDECPSSSVISPSSSSSNIVSPSSSIEEDEDDMETNRNMMQYMDDMFPALPYPSNEKKLLPTSCTTFPSSEYASADDFLQLIDTLEPISCMARTA